MNSEKKILVVEDYFPVLEDIAVTFEREGFTVLAASGPDKARELAENEKPNVIVLDLGLPNLEDGKELCSWLAKLPSKPPIIVLTRYDSNREKNLLEECLLDLGAADFINKPFTPSELVAKVKVHDRIRRQIGLGVPEVKIGKITYNRQVNSLVFPDRKKVNLTLSQSKVFEALLFSENRTATVSQLKKKLGYAANTSTRTVQTHIWRLRLLIRNGESGFPKIVTLENSEGYRLLDY